MEDLSIYIKKFKVAVGILVAGIILVIFLITKIVPAIQQLSQLKTDVQNQTVALQDAERKLENLKNEIKKEEAEESAAPKAIFRPITQGLDTEAAISDEFGEILQLIKENKIKARAVTYDYDPKDDKFVANAASKYHVCKVTAELIGTYSEFENFLRDLYKHEHFLDVSKIEITPYQKNKRILLINLVIKLYAQRDGSSEPAEAPKTEEKPSSNSAADKPTASSQEVNPEDM